MPRKGQENSGGNSSRKRLSASVREKASRVGRTVVRIGRLSLWTAFVGAILAGVWWSYRYTLSLPRYRQPVAISLAGLPDWLRLPANRHVVQQVLQSAGLTGRETITDPDLVVRVASNLAACPWVKKVLSVRIVSADRIEAYCQYREPVAWVQFRGRYYLVDEQAVRLPGEYPPEAIAGSGLLLVLGVVEGPPAVGRTWHGRDLAAGLKLIRMIRNRPVRRQVRAVVVSNYGGRIDPLSPDIELITDRRTSRIRWGHAPGEELPTEPTAEQKLALLEHYQETFGRIDLGRPYVDVRTWPAFQAAPQPSPPTRHSDRQIRLQAAARRSSA